MNFEEEFVSQFGDKYEFLNLKEVSVKKRTGVCTVTFLYSSTYADLTDEQKDEIISWLRKKLMLEKVDLKVKFMKAYLEERLILRAIQGFFDKKYKLITTYLAPENFKIKITPIDVLVDIEVSSRLTQFFIEHKICAELSKFLKENFLSEFVVNTIENQNLIDEVDIENVQMKTTYRVSKRYNVEIVKEIIGKNIITKPEYISYITSPKTNVIVAGFIKKIERKDFIIKKGKREGEQKAMFIFQLADGRGKIECIYFCPNRNVQLMEALEEAMFVLVHGEVKLNMLGKLTLQVDKLALANTIDEPEELDVNGIAKAEGKVVEIERLTALEQDNMFGRLERYNSKISGKTIVVFDIETTGLDPATDQIIELGAVKIEDGNIIEKFSTFVKPTKKIPFEVIELTGITNEMVEDAPPIEYVIKEFYDFTRGCVLSGHNVIGFDIKFVRNAGDNVGLDFDNELIDTLNEARVLKLSRFTLGNVTKALGISLEGAHRAWNDAFATAQVLLKLNELHK